MILDLGMLATYMSLFATLAVRDATADSQNKPAPF